MRNFSLWRARLLCFAALLAGVLTLTAASPIGVRPTAITLTPTLGNYADASLPLSTDTTVTPDAAPTNTVSINVSASTNFKGLLDANPTTGVVRVTDAHPAGNYIVTVRAFTTGGVSVSASFNLTVKDSGTCNPVSFARADFAVGSDPFAVAVGDFNGDGKQDLATANGDLPNVSILLGDGAGNFTAGTTLNIPGGQSVALAVGDFNGDGK